MPAPIVLFTYKRFHQTQKTIEALLANDLASESELFIYSDGPKTADDVDEIAEIRKYLRKIEGFKKVSLVEHEKNQGLAKSIVGGVTDVVSAFGKVIVLEDDIVTSPFFLRFMNDALDFYAKDERVMHISGYMYPHKKQLSDTFFFNVPLCWGWATWERAWKSYSDDSQDHFNYIEKNHTWKSFNKFGGKYLERQLRKNIAGTMNTWFINWHASVFRQNGLSLYPGTTLVDNIGFDSSGQHKASTNKFRSDLSGRKLEVKRIPSEENEAAALEIRRFYLWKRNSYVRVLSKIIKKIIS